MNEVLFDRGTKRTCQSCEARFYDLTRAPVLCPKCGTEYIEIVRPVTPPYQRRGRGVFGRSSPIEPTPVEESEAPEPETDGEQRELDGEAEPEAESEEAEE